MFCQYCGSKLPENARFCTNCGKMVANPGSASNNPSGTGHTPSQGGVWQQKESHQQPSYTEHLDPDKKGVPNQPSGANGYYTEPVKKDPWQQNSQQQYYSGQQYQSHQYQNQQYQNQAGYSFPQPQEKKRVRKLPILLACIAVAVVVGLALGAAGRKPETAAREKDKEQVQTVKPVREEKKQDEATSASQGRLRIGDNCFVITIEEFNALFDQALEEKGLPLYVFEEYSVEGDQHNFSIWDTEMKTSGCGVYFHLTEDPATGNLVKIAVSTYPEEGDTALNQKLETAARCAVEIAHGAMTQEKWDILEQETDVVDLSSSTTTTSWVDGMKYQIFNFGGEIINYVLTVEKAPGAIPQETGAPASSEASVSDNIAAALKRYPDGQLRTSDGLFQMDNHALASLFQHYLDNEGIPLTVGKKTAQDGGKFHYSMDDARGEQVGYLVMTMDTGSNRVKEASFTYYYQSGEDDHNNGTNAALSFIEAGHGNMTDKEWTIIANAKPFAEKEEYIMIAYKLGSMKATLTLRADRLFLNIEPES